jgi:hypothetical protein
MPIISAPFSALIPPVMEMTWPRATESLVPCYAFPALQKPIFSKDGENPPSLLNGIFGYGRSVSTNTQSESKLDYYGKKD